MSLNKLKNYNLNHVPEKYRSKAAQSAVNSYRNKLKTTIYWERLKLYYSQRPYYKNDMIHSYDRYIQEKKLRVNTERKLNAIKLEFPECFV